MNENNGNGNGGYKIIKGIVICKNSGEYLVDLILDTNINPILLSSFVSALSFFGKENLGKIEEIAVKGLDVEMIVVAKYDLILVTIMDKDFLEGEMRDEAENLLDIFYSCYQEEIGEDCSEIVKFEEFQQVLASQVQDYIHRMNNKEEIGDYGFFNQTIRRMRGL